MPKVISYTPEWLSKPNPGHNIFTPSKSATSQRATDAGSIANCKKAAKPGPRRTIAHRGTEVFIAVRKEIRWADLVYVKEAWENGESKRKSSSDSLYDVSDDERYAEDHARGYRTIKTPVADDIRQLVISPHSNYLAILTTHTVHIAILPDSSHLTARDTSPLRLRIHHLGPTTHVTSRPPVSSALWHPLGVNGSCVITITEDAVVRVWELSTAPRSYDRPTLAIDLKKLADGTSLDQDFSASVSATNTPFSPDSFEMSVASACFAARESGDWSPMTLWIAMREGDVYALCPLLPEKWSPPPELIPSLSVSVVAKVAAMEDDPNMPETSKLLAQQQLTWMSEIDNQEPLRVEGLPNEPTAEVYTRPFKPGRIPKLQGPFSFDLAPEESDEVLDGLLSDIYVIGGKLDMGDLMFGEEDDSDGDSEFQEDLSATIVCLLTSSSRLSVCLDLDGVEAQWLPKLRSKTTRFNESPNTSSLLTFDVMDTARNFESGEGCWPVFSPDVNSKYSFYITDTSSITFVSLSPWVSRLESELTSEADGMDFRMKVIVSSQKSIRERVFTNKVLDQAAPFSASIPIRDADLGYFLLTTTPYGPTSLTFEAPESNTDPVRRSRSPTYDEEPDKPFIYHESWLVYQPAHIFEENSALPSFLEKLRHSKYKRLLTENVRLSPAMLTIMTDAHKILSEETHHLGTAAAELFRRCENLQIELHAQIKKTGDLVTCVKRAIGDDNDDSPDLLNDLMQKRLEHAQMRQNSLNDRYDMVRRKLLQQKSRPLSDKEKAWIDELSKMEAKLSKKKDASPTREGSNELWKRFKEVKELGDEVLEQVNKSSHEAEALKSPNVKVTSDVRKAKVAQIMNLLDRETALVEGATNRLQNLSSAYVIG